ncbi:MAG: hypothetical protein KAJ51_10085, partial [Thermoplasmata archaeon]|nr:hypothetical protein [Thermoplasmata archaeon]
MKPKLKTIIIILTLIVSAIFFGLNLQITAIEPDNSPNNSLAVNNYLPLSAQEINWSQIEVISEPYFGQNYNQHGSAAPKIAVEGDKIYVVWHDATELDYCGLDYDIFYRFFDGYEWSEIQVISEPVQGKDFNTVSSYEPAIAVENGNV